MSKYLDIILFGATSFTGKHCIPILNKLAKANGRSLKWGIAGRSEDKMKKTLNEIKNELEDISIEDIPLIVADVKYEETLLKMAGKTNIVINCTGPFHLYGEPVVKACIEQSTHHVDVSGEPQYMEKMQLKYHKLAEEKGVYIVSACGFDSIPADVGITYLQEKFEGVLNSVVIYLEAGNAKESATGMLLNEGTWKSAVYGMGSIKYLKEIRKKLFQTRLPTFSPKLKQKMIHVSDLVDGWALPFPGSDRSVIRRSQRYFYEYEKQRPVQVETYFVVKSIFTILVLALFGLMFNILSRFEFGRSLLLKYPSFFSVGTTGKGIISEETIKNAWFSMIFYGEGWKEKLPEPNDVYKTPVDKAIIARIKASNPGYGFTNIALTLSAIMILTETDKLPGKGGVFPPGAAFAKTSLIKQLMENGTIVEIISEKNL